MTLLSGPWPVTLPPLAPKLGGRLPDPEPDPEPSEGVPRGKAALRKAEAEELTPMALEEGPPIPPPPAPDRLLAAGEEEWAARSGHE